MPWHRAAPATDVGKTLTRVNMAGRAVLVARTGTGAPVAVDPLCPHQNLPMDGGNVYGEQVDCPNHHYTYDAWTGENHYPKRVFPRARAAQVKPIVTYPACQQAGWVWVELPDG